MSEQQFAQTLSQAKPHHHHHHVDQDDASNGSSLQGALNSLLNATNGASSSSQLAQNLFSQIDINGDGSISKSELEQAVTSAGGTTQGADALYAQLDPNTTGSVSEQQLAQYLQPPSATGNTAQDALLAFIEPASQSASGITDKRNERLWCDFGQRQYRTGCTISTGPELALTRTTQLMEIRSKVIHRKMPSYR